MRKLSEIRENYMDIPTHSPQTVSIWQQYPELSITDYVFPSRPEKGFSNLTITVGHTEIFCAQEILWIMLNLQYAQYPVRCNPNINSGIFYYGSAEVGPGALHIFKDFFC